MGRFASGMKEKSDIFVAVSVVFVILIMIVPLNSFILPDFSSIRKSPEFEKSHFFPYLSIYIEYHVV